MRGGSYYEAVDTGLPAATPTQRIMVKAYPGERPVIHGYVELDNCVHDTVQRDPSMAIHPSHWEAWWA